jgi:ATP-dependent helicase HrpB
MNGVSLPVESALPELKEALSGAGCAVLVAAPGAGKTTRVPLALLDEPWLGGRKIVMLEPRRLAARSAARYMASLRREPVGGTVGYRVRMDTRVGPGTRIEVVTEGVLTRMLQEDPTLEEVGLVIFDEYHERSLQADLGLALCLQARELLRDDLRLLVMSATIEAEPVAALLGGAPVVVSEGRQYPVETRYRPPARPGMPMEEALLPIVREALRERDGDVLVFLPGMAEIRAAERRLGAELGGAAVAGGSGGSGRIGGYGGVGGPGGDSVSSGPGEPGGSEGSGRIGETGEVEGFGKPDEAGGADVPGGFGESGIYGRTSGISAVRIYPLHGSLSPEEQDRALAPSAAGERKIVLSTSVAETSLTVEGVTIVIDGGLSRVSRFSPRTGMTRLETTVVSAASADQRRGRAGRLAPGICYRLWSEEEQRRLPASNAPEIREADLAPLVLELAVWGTPDPRELRWLDPPPAPAVQQARELLAALGALAPDGSATAHGRRMAAFGLHPRLSHMILRAMPLGYGELACEISALIGEGRPIAGGGAASADFRLRLEALRSRGPHSMDEGVRRRLLDEAARLKRECGAADDRSGDGTGFERGKDARGSGAGRTPDRPSGGGAGRRLDRSNGAETGGRPDHGTGERRGAESVCGLLLAFAYPDRIGRRRENGKYLLSGGRGAALPGDSPLAGEEWIVAADVEDQGAEGRIRAAAPVALDDLLEYCPEMLSEERTVEWDAAAKAVRARVRRKLGALLLDERPLASPPADSVVAALLEGVREEGLMALPWTKGARQLQERVVFLRRGDPVWPDLSDEALASSLEEWLAPSAEGMRSLADLQRLDLKSALESMLTWEQRREMDRLAPSHWTVPSGSRLPIDYSDPDAPALDVRLQEMFGLSETPRIGAGRVPLTLRLLSPAGRPVQVTRDLASFWQGAYFDVRKDLRGRYPKHYWPDNPLEASATRRAKPRT